MLVANAFPDIEKDSDAHLHIGLALTKSFWNEAALTEMNQSLAMARYELQRFRALVGLAEVYEGLSQYDKACDVLNSALVIDHSELPEELLGTVAMDTKQAFITLAESRKNLGDNNGAVAAYRKAREAGKDESTELFDEIIEILDDANDYKAIIEEYKGCGSAFRTEWLMVHPTDLGSMHTIFQRAAKYCNEEDFLIHCYNTAINAIERRGSASAWRYHLAQVYRRVTCVEDDAYQLLEYVMKDKVFRKYADELEAVGRVLIEARDMFCEMIYDRIKAATDSTAKKALTKELGNLPTCIGQGNDPSNELHTLLLANAYLDLDLPNKAKKHLDQKFHICMEALSDTVGWNDCPSFILLARILAFAKDADLKRDAQIAFSAIYSAVDPKVSHHDSDSDSEYMAGLAEPLAEALAEIKLADAQNQPYDEDLAHILGFSCDGECSTQYLDCWTQPLYLCLTCVNVNLCEACYAKRMAQNNGQPSSFWRTYCGSNHQYIKGPIDGWGGVKGGIMTIGETKVKFSSWLKNVETKWGKANL
jgi:tetratricopeptide (TPR) repeat protein